MYSAAFFVILICMLTLHISTRQRSGNHLVRTLLNSVAGCHILFEPFHRVFAEGCEDFWHPSRGSPRDWLTMRREAIPGLSVFGWLLQSEQRADWLLHSYDVQPDCLQLMSHAIVLWRRDLLQQYLSLQNAFATGVWSRVTTDTVLVPPPMRVDVAELHRHCQKYCAELDQDLQEVQQAGKPYLVVCYEDLVEDRAGQLTALGAFLGLDTSTATTDLVKMEQRPLDEAIVNYREARRLVDLTTAHQLYKRS